MKGFPMTMLQGDPEWTTRQLLDAIKTEAVRGSPGRQFGLPDAGVYIPARQTFRRR
jgi:hypothetical protein